MNEKNLNNPKSNFNNFLAEALKRMQADGLSIADPICDGKLHRCPIADKPKDKDGSYIIHADNPFTAWWRNWKTGNEDTYCEKSAKDMTPKERKAFKAMIAEQKQQAQAERETRQKEGAEKAIKYWNSGKTVSNHPYLQKKEVKSYGLRVDNKGNLLIPIKDLEGKLHSLQWIPANSNKGKWDKLFISGGKKGGNCYPITGKDGLEAGPLLIAEGYATAASIHAATGYSILVAFDCHNFMEVAKAARAKWQARQICICADYDIPKDEDRDKFPEPGGIGVAKAKEAAQAIGAYLAICPSIEGGKADFNDLAVHYDLLRVQSVIEDALKGEPANNCPMPHGYFIVPYNKRNSGLYYHKENADGTGEDIRLGPILEVLGATRDKDGNDWGLMLQWKDADNKEHTWAMPDTFLYAQSGELLTQLAHGGWLGNPACKKLIAAFLTTCMPIKRYRCITHTGWYNNCYVLPEVVYGQSNCNEQIVLQSLHYTGLYQTGGSLENWQEMAALCVENFILCFTLSCAFAGPLLSIAGMEGGAFSLEGDSSCGKTTALKVAASVWGNTNHLRGWRTTDNGLECTAALHNDNLLILDELSQVKARVLDEAIYMLANGTGKARSGKDGTLRKSQYWLALVLSSGELGLADKLAEDGKRSRAGQDVRFCGVPVEKSDIIHLHGMTDAGQLIRRITELCGENYGHAGRLYLQKLTMPENLEHLRSLLRGELDSIVKSFCPKDTDSQIMRVAMRFALAGYAGRLAAQWEILPRDFDAISYAKICFDRWLEKRGGPGAAEDAAILAQVKLIIERDGQSRFQDIKVDTQYIVNRLGFVDRSENDAIEYIILPEQFKAEFAKGYGEKRVTRVLNDAGWLRKDRSGRAKARRSLPGMGRQECYVIKIKEIDT